MKQAVRDRLIDRNPTDFVDLPRRLDYEPSIYTETDLKKLINAVKGTDDELIILIASSMGLRRGYIILDI